MSDVESIQARYQEWADRRRLEIHERLSDGSVNVLVSAEFALAPGPGRIHSDDHSGAVLMRMTALLQGFGFKQSSSWSVVDVAGQPVQVCVVRRVL